MACFALWLATLLSAAVFFVLWKWEEDHSEFWEDLYTQRDERERRR